MGLEVALLAVDRDKELGPNQGVDDLQLVLAGVAGDVEGAGVLADHLGLFPVQFVDDIVDGALVAGDGGGGDDHPVPGLDLHLLVGGEGDAEEGGHGLPLAAGGDDAHLVLGQGLDVVDVHHDPFGDVGVPQFGGHPHGVLHAPAGDGHFPAIAGGHIDDLLDPVHVGGEGGDDDPLLAALEELVEAGPHGPLRAGVAGALHVGGVAQQGQDPFLAQLAQAGQVHDLPLDGGGVNLKVPGVDHHAHRALDGEAHRVGDGVVGVDELHGKLPRLDHVPGLAGDQLGGVQQLVLLQFQAHQPQGHPGGVDRGLEGPQHIGQRPDVVLVPVGEKNAPDLVLVLDEIAHIGDHHVHTVHVVVREPHAHVYDDDVVAILVDGEILADLIEPAQGNDFQFFCHNNSFSVEIPRSQTKKSGHQTQGSAERTRSPCPAAGFAQVSQALCCCVGGLCGWFFCIRCRKAA